MSCEAMWSNEEVKEIWSEDFVSYLPVATHKNKTVFKIFGSSSAAFSHTVEQFHIKDKNKVPFPVLSNRGAFFSFPLSLSVVNNSTRPPPQTSGHYNSVALFRHFGLRHNVEMNRTN